MHANLGVFLAPDVGQTVLVEQHRHVERVFRRQREIPAEGPDRRGRRHGVIIRVHAVDGAALKCLEKLARGDDLVGIEKLDFQLTLGGGVDCVDGGFRHLFA